MLLYSEKLPVKVRELGTAVVYNGSNNNSIFLGVEKMDLSHALDIVIESLKTNPEMEISNNTLRVLNDVAQCEQHDSNYTYLYLNRHSELSYTVLVTFRALLDNMLDNESIDPDTLTVGDLLLYAAPKTHSTQSVTFQGLNLSQKHGGEKYWDIKRTNTRGDSRGLTFTISTSDFKARISLAAGTSTVVKTDSRKKFAETIKLDRFSRTDSKKIVVLVDKPIIDQLEHLTLRFYNSSFDYGRLILSRTLKNTDAFGDFRRTDRTSRPFVTFVSSLTALDSYLDQGMSEETQLYIIGDKWWEHYNDFFRSSVFELARASKITIRILASTSALMKGQMLRLLSSMRPIYAWFGNANKITFNVQKIDIPEIIECNWQVLDDYIEESKENENYSALSRHLLQFRTNKFASVVSHSPFLTNLHDEIINEIRNLRVDYDYQQALQDAVNGLMADKYDVLLDNQIDAIGNGTKTLVITSDNLVDETRKNFLFRRKRADVHGFSELIRESWYEKYEVLILLNPRTSERRKWVLSAVASRIEIIYPSQSWDSKVSSMQNDVILLRAISQYDDIDDGSAVILANAISSFLDTLMSNKINSRTFIEETNEDDSLYQKGAQETDSDFVSQLLDRHEESSVTDLDDSNTSRVSAKYWLTFDEKKDTAVFGTANGRLLLLMKNDFLEQVPIRRIKSGDVVAYVRLEDSVFQYRQEFKKLLSNLQYRRSMLELDSDKLKDFHWKREFLYYCDRQGLSALQIQQRFSRKGYNRSVAFFNSWKDIDKLSFVPRDVDFIRIIGLLVNEPEMVDRAADYRNSSLKVREDFQNRRQGLLEQFINQPVSEVRLPLSFLTVTDVKVIDREMMRSKTNKVLEYYEY